MASSLGWALLAEAYAATYLAIRNRWMDLVELASTRHTWAADQRPQPLLIAAATGQRAGALLNCGDCEGGLSVVDRGLVAAQTRLSGREKAFATGVLHLRGMTLAGRLHDRTETQRHIHAVRSAAEEFPHELQLHGQRFGPALTALS